MKKEIVIKQEEKKEVDFKKIKNVTSVDVSPERIILEVETDD